MNVNWAAAGSIIGALTLVFQVWQHWPRLSRELTTNIWIVQLLEYLLERLFWALLGIGIYAVDQHWLELALVDWTCYLIANSLRSRLMRAHQAGKAIQESSSGPSTT